MIASQRGRAGPRSRPGPGGLAGRSRAWCDIDRGRGPEFAGTRITVYDVLDDYRLGWHRNVIAAILGLNSRQVEAAIRYI